MRDLTASLWLVAMVLLVAGAVVWLIPAQADLSHQEPAQDCVQIGLEYRGLPQCDGLEPGTSGVNG